MINDDVKSNVSIHVVHDIQDMRAKRKRDTMMGNESPNSRTRTLAYDQNQSLLPMMMQLAEQTAHAGVGVHN